MSTQPETSAELPIEFVEAPPAYPPTDDEKPRIHERVWGLDARCDPTVSFQEYDYWAKIERQEEKAAEIKYNEMMGPWSFKKMIKGRFSKGVHHETKKREEEDRRQQAIVSMENVTDDKGLAQDPNVSDRSDLEAEWRTAARALRTATWGSIFYLVTTDILGWSGAPFVFASVGYGLGIGIYLVFGIAAGLSGLMLWKVFVSLDSTRFPILSFGDLFLRVFGVQSRRIINILQSLQMFCSVCVVVFGNAQLISQLAGPNLCFVACIAISMAVGMVSIFVRSLQRIGWICNLAVWLNITSFIIIMVASKKFPIDYTVITSSTLIKTIEPVKTFVGIPPASYQEQVPGFAATFNAIDTMVYAYSGALLFVAFLAEMRHPMDFWKGVILAQAFICFVYMLFGAYVYSNFGQYSGSNINQVINPEGLRNAGNVLGLLTGFIANFLYFNVGLKTVYIEVFQEVFKFPPIVTKKGRVLWTILGPIYWVLAFILAAAVPNLNGIVNVISGLLSINFTYSFPALVFIGWSIHEGAKLPGEGFDPATGVATVHDRGPKRWFRGFVKRWHWNFFCLLYMLGGFACSGMGTWAAVEGLISIFGPGGTVARAFACPSPVWG